MFTSISQHHTTQDPSLLSAIRHIDHVTYADSLQHEKDFIKRWQIMGFEEHVRLHTQRYPASHIALVSGKNDDYPWETMTGLSVSPDPKSPINEFVRRYGPGMQHPAYNINPSVDMEALYIELTKTGWKFMTPVLTHSDEGSARLKQMFVAPTIPYGPFIEFVQRLPGEDGHAFDSFDIENIDDLYEEYDKYSRFLEKKQTKMTA